MYVPSIYFFTDFKEILFDFPNKPESYVQSPNCFGHTARTGLHFIRKLCTKQSWFDVCRQGNGLVTIILNQSKKTVILSTGYNVAVGGPVHPCQQCRQGKCHSVISIPRDHFRLLHGRQLSWAKDMVNIKQIGKLRPVVGN